MALSCDAPKPPPAGTPPPAAVTLNGRRIEVALLVSEKERRAAPASLAPAEEGRGYLMAWPRGRFMKLDSNPRASFDVAFFHDGKVVDHLPLPQGGHEGIVPNAEADAALLVPAGFLRKLDCKIGDAAEIPAVVATHRSGEQPAVRIGESVARVELALNAPERARGLMFRPRMSADDGMLFVYPPNEVRAHQFWMANTLIPLDIAFLRPDGTIINVNETPCYPDPRRPPSPYPTSDAAEPAQFVLEMNLGWFKRKGLVDAAGKVKPGLRAELPPEALQGRF